MIFSQFNKRKVFLSKAIMAILFALSFSASMVHAETEGDWGVRVLAIQNSIDHDAPFSETTWPGTHNSFSNNSDDDFWNVALNQSKSRKQQMDRGIRQLVFDIHYSFTHLRLCHNGTGFGSCIKGITGYKRLKVGLNDIGSFLEANPNEVIFLKLEILDSAKSKYAQIAKELNTYVGDYIYQTDLGLSIHGDMGDHCTKLPTDVITKSKVLSAGKNLVVFTGHGCDSNDAFSNLVFYGDSNLKTRSTVSDIIDDGDTARRTTMSRVFDGRVKGDSSGTLKLKPSTIDSYLDVGLNIIEVYGFNGSAGGNTDWNGDGEAPLDPQDFIWSWNTYEPSGNGNCVELEHSSGKFDDYNCNSIHHVACRKLVENDGSRAYEDWMVTDAQVTFENAESQCLSEGGGEYFFAVPRNKMELNTLINVTDSAGISNDIWVNYEQSSDGSWVPDIGEADADMKAYCDNGGSGTICSYIDSYLDLLITEGISTAIGGSGGNYFNDLSKLGTSPEVKKVSLRTGSRVDQISTTYASGTTLSHGGSGGSSRSLTLNAGEYISKAYFCKGNYKDGDRIFYAKLTTNTGRTLSGGSITSSCETFSAPAGSEIVGFWGSSGSALDKVGILYLPY